MPPGSEESLASRRLPRKVESLESLYFTPIPSRTRSQLESSAGSLGDLSLDSGCKTRSARRRTTINITMTKVSGVTGQGGIRGAGRDPWGGISVLRTGMVPPLAPTAGWAAAIARWPRES